MSVEDPAGWKDRYRRLVSVLGHPDDHRCRGRDWARCRQATSGEATGHIDASGPSPGADRAL